MVVVGVSSGALPSCYDARDVSGVYVETFFAEGAASDRAYALRVTAFEFEELVGGWVEYYALSGLNTAEDPFIEPSACAYFGPYRRTGAGFVVLAPGLSPNEDLQVRFSSEARRTMLAVVEQEGGVFVDDVDGRGRALVFEPDTQSPSDGCPPAVPLIDRPLLDNSLVADDPLDGTPVDFDAPAHDAREEVPR